MTQLQTIEVAEEWAIVKSVQVYKVFQKDLTVAFQHQRSWKDASLQKNN